MKTPAYSKTRNKNSWGKWLTLLPAILLSACIDSGGVQLADGIGGTGISTGRLTGFGSVYVNGIHFNTDNARFTRDGNTSAELDNFNIGEIIKVVGTINEDRQSGIASEVIYSDVLEGPVTEIINGKKLEVLGQQVATDEHTVLHGFNKLSELLIDNIIEVSGYTNANGDIYASSIKLISTQFNNGDTLEAEGSISQLDRTAYTFRINDLVVDYSQATLDGLDHSSITNGMYLVVTTQQNISNNTMTATEITLIDDALETDITYEIEGFVTRFTSLSNFEIDGYPVTTNAETLYKNGNATDINADSFMLLTGTVNDQSVLVADEITLFDYDAEIFVEAHIETIDAEQQTLNVLGQTITVDSTTLFSDDTSDAFTMLDISEFYVGQPVFVIAYPQDNGEYLATRLSRINPIDSVYLSGPPTITDAAQGSLMLFGNQIISDEETFYLDETDNELSRTAFFNRVALDSGAIGITGISVSDGFIRATLMALTPNEE